MGVYFGTTEITGLYFGDTEITGLYFGDTEIWAAWAEYDGALPAQYSANGSALADYRVYGAAEGVGDRTENLLDVSQIKKIGIHYQSGNYTFECDENTTYMFLSSKTMQAVYVYGNADYSSDRIAVSYTTGRISFNTGARSTVYIRFDLAKTSDDYRTANLMLVKGSTAPAEYIPYGYEVDMSVSDGSTATTTPVYIGDTPLGEDEYVSFKEQKIYRMSGGVLTPTDPPVPLPALPTVDGTTITDYAGQSAAVPERFVAKYRKG